MYKFNGVSGSSNLAFGESHHGEWVSLFFFSASGQAFGSEAALLRLVDGFRSIGESINLTASSSVVRPASPPSSTSSDFVERIQALNRTVGELRHCL